jgi:hypothetical protein
MSWRSTPVCGRVNYWGSSGPTLTLMPACLQCAAAWRLNDRVYSDILAAVWPNRDRILLTCWLKINRYVVDFQPFANYIAGVYQRNIVPLIHETLQDTPVVHLNGARQTGKSTLVRSGIVVAQTLPARGSDPRAPQAAFGATIPVLGYRWCCQKMSMSRQVWRLFKPNRR